MQDAEGFTPIAKKVVEDPKDGASYAIGYGHNIKPSE